MLCSSWDLAQDINGKRRSEAGKLISTLEAKHNFSVNLQMADNFMCRGVSCICILLPIDVGLWRLKLMKEFLRV